MLTRYSSFIRIQIGEVHLYFIYLLWFFFEGVISNGHVRCPWHGACFSLKTGDIEDFPGIDSLPSYEVKYKMQMTMLVLLALCYELSTAL